MKIIHFISIVLISLQILISYSFGQFSEVWNMPYLYTNLKFVGNCDDDSNDEFVFVQYEGGDKILITDGITGELEWESETFNDLTDVSDDVIFTDVNHDAIYEILLIDKGTLGTGYHFYAFGDLSTAVYKPNPESSSISQNKNYPNPFHSSMTIKYSVDNYTEVFIEIFDNYGSLIKSFNEGYKGVGEYKIQWDGKKENGISIGNGIYYYKIHLGQKELQGKIIKS